MERKIGEVFNHKGEWYQCIQDEFPMCCGNCDFYNSGFKKCDDDTVGECMANHRADRHSICFKKLEKVGEPFCANYYGTTKTMQMYKLYHLPAIMPNDCPIYCMMNEDKNIIIEVKQDQENMEEKIQHYDCFFDKKESNLKPFDLEAAKAGKPVCTRDGRKARIICFDRNNKNCQGEKYPIVALITGDNGVEEIGSFDNNGKIMYDSTYCDSDLMMFPEKHEGWTNVYKDGQNRFTRGFFQTKETAENATNPPGAIRIATVQIVWEE